MRPHHPSPQRASHRAGFFTSKNTYRKTNNRSNHTKFNIGDYVPLLTRSQAETTNHLTQLIFEALGVSDIKSYFKKLLWPIAICVVLSTVIGACVSGFLGFFFGAIAGIIVPAALICLAPIVGYVAVCLVCVVAASAVLFYGAIWLFSW
jgi:hypothetical protein